MIYERIAPDPRLARFVECFWLASDPAAAPKIEKIIPDGFIELIFHFGDPYLIRLDDHWKKQGPNLLAGQLNKHFYLQNSGVADILAVKLKPTAIHDWFGINMADLTNKVVDAGQFLGKAMEEIIALVRIQPDHPTRIAVLTNYFDQLSYNKILSATDRAVDLIFEKHGMLTISTLCEYAGVGERQLENLFRKHVGLSPKLFCRIIRFNYIFECARDKSRKGSDLAFEAAFYDQSHFIRNFRDFTGENPGDYGFDEKNMANFFMLKRS